MTLQQYEELSKWAATVDDRGTLEDFLGWLRTQGHDCAWKPGFTLETVLDQYFEIDRVLLESARQTLLEDSRLAAGGAQ
jgi:hypothetical protein